MLTVRVPTALLDRADALIEAIAADSGIATALDVARLQVHGVRAVLVGETLMRADDIGRAVRSLIG